MNPFVKLYLLSVPLFFLIDILWLGVLAKRFYRSRLSPWLSDQTDWIAAVVFYLLFLIGLTYFSTWPAYQAGAERQALINGALYGFFTYATYELTNKALIANWPLPVVLVDIAWGAVLCAAVSWGSCKLGMVL